MHYPVMTEKHVADRWQVSLKTLRRWRLDGDGPAWHKLFRHVQHYEADVLDFEHGSAQHLMTLLGLSGRKWRPGWPVRRRSATVIESTAGFVPQPLDPSWTRPMLAC